MGTAIVGLVLLLIVAAVIRKIIKPERTPVVAIAPVVPAAAAIT